MGKKMRDCLACGHSVSKSALNCPSCGHRLRKPRRGVFGLFFAVLFWGWNVFCAFMFFAIITDDTIYEVASSAPNAAAQGGAITGLGIGFGLMLALWLIGAVITGLFVLITRPS